MDNKIIHARDWNDDIRLMLKMTVDTTEGLKWSLDDLDTDHPLCAATVKTEKLMVVIRVIDRKTKDWVFTIKTSYYESNIFENYFRDRNERIDILSRKEYESNEERYDKLIEDECGYFVNENFLKEGAHGKK